MGKKIGSRTQKIMAIALNKNTAAAIQDTQETNDVEASLDLYSQRRCPKRCLERCLEQRPESPLPPGAEENYEALRDIVDEVFNDSMNDTISDPKKHDTDVDTTKEHDIDVDTTTEYEINVDTTKEQHIDNANVRITPTSNKRLRSIRNNTTLSPFNLDVTQSFENSPMPPEVLNDIFSNINVPTPCPSPVNSHSAENCTDAFCPEHTDWVGTLGSNPNTPSSIKSTPKCRIRKRHTSEWSDVKRKMLKNKGSKYITRKGKPVDEKVLKPPCKCRMLKCFNKISLEQRLAVFSRFWAIGNRHGQWSFVIKYTNKKKKMRMLNTETHIKNRQYTFKYFLPLITDDSSNLDCPIIEVCKTMFLNTLSCGTRIVSTAWDKFDGTSVSQNDLRGCHKNHKKVITEDMIKSVVDHVKSFQPIESHYLREKTTKLYLDGSLSIARMYKMYKEWYDSDVYVSQAKSERQYRDIVNENFNLGFFIPKKDQCDQCHVFENLQNPTNEQKEEYENHRKNRKIARKLKKTDKKDAQTQPDTVVCAVFDFEKVLTCPSGQVSIFYYKRKLSCFNFTIYDMGKKEGICCMWDETIAKKGSNEVSSCLYEFIEINAGKGISDFRFWSDNCAGQNRNRIVYYMYVYAAIKFNVTITHRFMEKGHTQNEGDSVHSTIETASRPKKIYTPEEWQLLVRWAKNDDDEHYIVKNMSQKHIFDFKSKVVDKVWNKNICGHKVAWNNIKEVHVNKNSPYKLNYKYDFNDETYGIVSLGSSTRSNDSLGEIYLAYDQRLHISNDKYKDLVSMCNMGIIPEQHVSFFKNLPHGSVQPVAEEEENSENR